MTSRNKPPLSDLLTRWLSLLNAYRSDPIAAFLWGELFLYVGRGYLLVVFTQLLYRATGNLWHNLLYFTSDSVFAFVVPLFIGAWIDRNGSSKLLRIGSAGTSITLLVCALVSKAGVMTAQGMLAASLVTSMLNAGMRVCVFTLIPLFASTSELIRINGRQQAACQLGTLGGVLLAGVLLDIIGASASFALLAAVSMVATYCYHIAGKRMILVSDEKKESIGLRFIHLLPALFRSPMLIVLFIVGASDMLAVSLFNLALPVLVAHHFVGHSFALAGIDSLFTVGAVTLGWFVGRISLQGQKLHSLLILMPITLLAWMTQLLWFNSTICFFLTFFSGFTVSSYSVYFTAVMQAFVPSELRGRFAALRRMISTLIVSGSAYCFAASYARQDVQGAVFITLIIEASVLIACITWFSMRQRLQNSVRMNLDRDNRQDQETADHYQDLKIAFKNFIASTR